MLVSWWIESSLRGGVEVMLSQAGTRARKRLGRALEQGLEQGLDQALGLGQALGQGLGKGWTRTRTRAGNRTRTRIGTSTRCAILFNCQRRGSFGPEPHLFLIQYLKQESWSERQGVR